MNPQEYLDKLIKKYVEFKTEFPSVEPVFKVDRLNFELICQYQGVDADRLLNTRALTLATPMGMMRLEKN